VSCLVDSQSYCSGSTEQPLLHVTVGSLFDDIAAKLPDHEALISRHENLKLTYSQLRQEIDEFAMALIGWGRVSRNFES
jgi:fatty-acyl-CoA synthase